jgi:uncharacterized caspase-like protein
MLRYSGQDALKVAEAVRTFMGPSYVDVLPYALIDSDATEVNILHAFEEVRRGARLDDTVVVFLSGHGVVTPDDRFYFIAVDGRLSPPDVRNPVRGSPGRGFVDLSVLQRALAATFGRRLLLLDLSRSGSIASIVTGNAAAEQISVLTASGPNQFAQESPEWGGGLFTHALIEGISGQAASKETGEISISDLGEYVNRRVQLLSNGNQTPSFFTDRKNTILGSAKRDTR